MSRFAVEVKTARGDHPRIARGLESALADLDAERGWIVDQAEGIDRLGVRIARGGFEALQDGTPA